MHEYLTIENLLKRYLVTFTIQIQATGRYWVFEMRQICQIWLFYFKAQLVPNIRLLLFGDLKFQKSCCWAHLDKEIHYWILAVLWYLLNLVLICYFGQGESLTLIRWASQKPGLILVVLWYSKHFSYVRKREVWNVYWDLAPFEVWMFEITKFIVLLLM